jgi:electron transfer flavoprotein beta subunit
MDIVVCLKRIPDTSETEDIVEIDDSGKGIKQSDLIFKLNEWDEYALEEAMELKEKLGGTVTAITAGLEEYDEILRRALAMGADKAIRVETDTSATDSYALARILSAAINNLPHDLVLFGMQSQDTGRGQLGVMVAELLCIPYAVGVTRLLIQDNLAKVAEELEGGLLALYSLKLPALLTIQTGINQPRYVSISSIRKARKKELSVSSLDELGLSREALTMKVKLEKLYVPTAGKDTKMISGTVEEEASELANLIREIGVLK